jgi:hypothetical protein
MSFIIRLILTAVLLIGGLPFFLFIGAVLYFITLPDSVSAIWKAGKKSPDLQKVFTYGREGK